MMAELESDTTVLDGLNLSPSAAGAAEALSSFDTVPAWSIVEQLIQLHPEYAGGKAKEIRPPSDLDGAHQMPVAEWLTDLRTVLDRTTAQKLNGRYVILGLSLLEPELGRQLMADDFLDTLVDEITEPIDALLSSDGMDLWKLLHEREDHTPDAVPIHSDDPAQVDLLGRDAFARALAIRLRAARLENMAESRSDEPRAFLMHIHGPWGSGKTSLLNFLKDALRAPWVDRRIQGVDNSAWLVVDFNAWQHQRVDPPWWSLMDSVYTQASAGLDGRWQRTWFRLREWWWRLTIGRGFLIASLVLFLISIALFILAFSPAFESISGTLGSFAEAAKPISALLALAGSLWAALLGLSRSLLPGSAKAARTYMESARDPLASLARHFEKMLISTQQPIAIFVDDLDRCGEQYAIKLLEGIQTLFRRAGITYVVAADRRWLRASFEKVYSTFAGIVDEPGRPLGYLFLEKTFQLSVSLPRLSPKIQEDYWNRLIGMGADERDSRDERDTGEARRAIEQLSSEAQILSALADVTGNPTYDSALRSAAIERLAAPDIMEHTERHTLRDFHTLMDPNPRAMKRLVNAYGVQRLLDILRGGRTAPKVLALWTIVNLRWPLLAEFLEKQPEKVSEIGNQNPVGIDDEGIKDLLSDDSVMSVIEGTDIDAAIDEAAIRSLANLRTSATSLGSVL